MEIIDELENDRRGIYGGCVGYFGADGTMDTCIVLRTAIVKDGKIYVQAGAGIVADSDPARAAGMRKQGARPFQRRRGGATLSPASKAGREADRWTHCQSCPAPLTEPEAFASLTIPLDGYRAGGGTMTLGP